MRLATGSNGMRVIYEPRGRAREYSPLSLNLYNGCSHACRYCYVPAVCKKHPEMFHAQVSPRKDILGKIEKDCKEIRGEDAQVLFCFTSDPYQEAEKRHGLTQQAIEIFRENNVSFQVLTKGGMLAARDFDLYTPRDQVAATMTFLDDKDSLEWEPGAVLPGERMEMLRLAKSMGIRTWVSLEPVIDPEQSLEIIRQTHGYVDRYKVGKLNYHERAKEIDWEKFAADAVTLLEEHGCEYYVKKDLRRYMYAETAR